MFGFLKGNARHRFSAAEAIRGVATGEVVVIDVRESAEVAETGQAAGSVHVPLMMLAFRADPAHPDHLPQISPEKTVAVYCASGGRSASAVRVLDRLGYRDVHNIGGLGHWVRAGGQVVKV
ncbi:rhodanese-like domain-containing protein [Maritimibacter alkaliphilus]|uniref:rhodanese-like domain-containing protein n=1 Tax=Maritimibacter alkaliphilus TaxID=404236 RepID=UPI001C959AB0|nr:rhodanese-like domain-containing protein [Maritimibacter alkaliphilus]MBY6089149.1 sulfurtransferase [Maritimibacter alkaliphilus]